jgi:putative drug exporter of the RND superfamily
VQQNQASSFLPSSAESTRALELQRQFPGGDRLPVVVVYRRGSGITPADRALATGHRGELAQRFAGGRKEGRGGSPVVPSEDGTALLYAVPCPPGMPSAWLIRSRPSARRSAAATATWRSG